MRAIDAGMAGWVTAASPGWRVCANTKAGTSSTAAISRNRKRCALAGAIVRISLDFDPITGGSAGRRLASSEHAEILVDVLAGVRQKHVQFQIGIADQHHLAVAERVEASLAVILAHARIADAT